MKTILALGVALLFAVPVAAEAAQDNRRQERSFQNAERGGFARAQRREVRPQRQAVRPQRQARPRQQARPQQRQARAQRQMRPDVRPAQRAAGVQDRGQMRGRAAGTGRQFRQETIQRPDRFARNPLPRSREAPNRASPNRATRNRPGPNRAVPNRQDDWQRRGRFAGNRGDGWNGPGPERNGAFRGPGRNRYAARDSNWNRRYGDDRYWRRDHGGRRQFFYRGHYRPAIRLRPYHYPRGYYYTTWRIGAYLPMLFLSAQFFYDDYYQLGLAPPPPGYRWVRYGPDLLLVELYSGQVVDVVTGVFYW
jgi:Ni/Co efflux regulator RcnB